MWYACDRYQYTLATTATFFAAGLARLGGRDRGVSAAKASGGRKPPEATSADAMNERRSSGGMWKASAMGAVRPECTHASCEKQRTRSAGSGCNNQGLNWSVSYRLSGHGKRDRKGGSWWTPPDGEPPEHKK